MEREGRSVNQATAIHILPYSRIVGQEQLKLALELAYIAPRLGGVLIAGQRGTAKSTAVRAFAQMVYGDLPVTLPINATEDRVIGGWQIEALMHSKAEPQPGLLEEANGKLLYIDEINLLDDHIVNLILDVTSTGVLTKEHEGQHEQKQVSFTLAGTMNPEEGGLRPQLLDRFGLMVSVTVEKNAEQRSEIVRTVMDFDEALHQLKAGQAPSFITMGRRMDQERRVQLDEARARLQAVKNREFFPDEIAKQCVALSAEFNVESHRGDYVTALAACALAVLEGAKKVDLPHLHRVARLALHHRRREFLQSGQWFWSNEDQARLDRLLGK